MKDGGCLERECQPDIRDRKVRTFFRCSDSEDEIKVPMGEVMVIGIQMTMEMLKMPIWVTSDSGSQRDGLQPRERYCL